MYVIELDVEVVCWFDLDELTPDELFWLEEYLRA